MRKTTFFPIVLILSAAIVFFNACKKEAAQDETNSNSLTKEIIAKVNSWLDSQKITFTDYRRSNIESLKENLDLNAGHLESYKQNDQFIIVPVKNGFKSKNNKDKNPFNYLVLVLSEKGDITNGNLIQYISSTELKQAPKNTFSKIFNYQNLECDGQFTMLSIADDFRYELKFENGKLKSVAERRSKNSSGNQRTNECIDWYLVTTYYYSNGSSETFEQYVFTTCDCHQTRMANGRSFQIECGGGGGGNSIDYEYEVAQYVTWNVAVNPVNSIGEIKSYEYIKGKRVSSEPQGGHFKSIYHNSSICDFCYGSNPNDYWNEDLASSGVTDPQHCFMAIYGVLHYQGIVTNINNTKTWQFQDLF
jgi:hypothetical protein